jgi:hypothetical protein
VVWAGRGRGPAFFCWVCFPLAGRFLAKKSGGSALVPRWVRVLAGRAQGLAVGLPRRRALGPLLASGACLPGRAVAAVRNLVLVLLSLAGPFLARKSDGSALMRGGRHRRQAPSSLHRPGPWCSHALARAADSFFSRYCPPLAGPLLAKKTGGSPLGSGLGPLELPGGILHVSMPCAKPAVPLRCWPGGRSCRPVFLAFFASRWPARSWLKSPVGRPWCPLGCVYLRILCRALALRFPCRPSFLLPRSGSTSRKCPSSRIPRILRPLRAVATDAIWNGHAVPLGGLSARLCVRRPSSGPHVGLTL